MKANRTYIATITLLLLLSILSSCGLLGIGLGTAIDIEAPEVTVLTPETLSSVTKSFTVSGTASDNTAVSLLTVTVSEAGHEYKLEKNTWYKKENGSWTPYASGTCTGDESYLNWSLRVTLDSAVAGDEFIIVTEVSDTYGNSGKKSSDERLVTIDTVIPNVSIIEPTLFDTVPDLTNPLYQTISTTILSNLVNHTFTMSGSQKEDSVLATLIIYLDAKESTNVPAVSEPMTDYVVKKTVTGDNLRNWSTQITEEDFPAEYRTGIHTLRVVTESHDKAGNVERKALGWFLYWNEADKPWVEFKQGFASPEDQVITSTIYPNCELTGYAYDDDGLKKVVVELYEVDDSGNEQLLAEKCKDFAAELTANRNPGNYAWSINALGYTTKFSVHITPYDIYDKPGDTVIRYFRVTDTNPPEFISFTPTSGTGLYDISTDGTFNITVKVKDNGQVNALKMVRIGSGNESTMAQYYSASNSCWAKVKAGTTYATDGTNQLYYVPIPAADPKATGETDSTYTITIPCNLFAAKGVNNGTLGFGIDGTNEYLKNQNFIFLALDNDGTPKIESYSLTGDSEAPAVSITKLEVKTGSTVDEAVTDFSSTPVLKPFDRSNQKIVLSGTYGDTYLDKYGKKGTLAIDWAGVTVQIDSMNNGEWVSKPISIPTASTASIKATYTDWSGISKSHSISFSENSALPKLLRVTSTKEDGYYNSPSGTTKIGIILEFNKNVTFSNCTPYLQLSNGKTATYTTGNGTTEMQFDYTVGASDAADPLTVTGLAYSSGAAAATWKDDAGFTCDMSSLPAIDRTLTIDTAKPELQSLAFNTTAGWYKEGANIYIKGTFDEPVIIAEDALSTIKLRLNSGTDQYAVATQKINDTTILFEYKVPAGTYVQNLNATAFVCGASAITDQAGNVFAVPQSLPALAAGRNIDSTAPVQPAISGVTDNASYYDRSTTKVTFTVQFEKESNTASATKKWVTTNGSVYTDVSESTQLNKTTGVYTGTVSATGRYTIGAYEEDRAGNVSDYADSVSFTIDNETLITSISADKPDGTYTHDPATTINIYVNLRSAVTVTGIPTMTINVKNGDNLTKDIRYTGKTGESTKQLKFSYVVASGDSCNGIEVASINYGDTSDIAIGGVSVKGLINPGTLEASKKLSASRSLSVATTVPALGTPKFSADGTTLTLPFGNDYISKNTGYITITLKKGDNDKNLYRAPVTLTEDEYLKYKDRISAYYSIGINGSDGSGNADTTTKYILDFAKTGDDATVVAAFTDAKTAANGYTSAPADVVSFSVTSSAVSYNAEHTALVIDMTQSGTKLPIKGDYYTLSIGSSLVLNNLGTGNSAVTKDIRNPGIEVPVIRINKTKESISGTTVTQPTSAQFKIDCQTDNTEICYWIKDITPTRLYLSVDNLATTAENSRSNDDTVCISSSSRYFFGGTAGNKKKITARPAMGISFGASDTVGYYSSNNANKKQYKYSGQGSLTTTNWYDAYRAIIAARAFDKADTTHNTYSEQTYETAFRTVIVYQEGDLGNKDEEKKNNKIIRQYRWIRGGDRTDGGVSTTGFPLSWNRNDTDKIRAMTQNNGTKSTSDDLTVDNEWYWISWDLTDVAYIQFLTGDMPNDAATKGPSSWCWSSCGWIPNKADYPIYPGESTTFNTSWKVSGQYWGYSYLTEKHVETR